MATSNGTNCGYGDALSNATRYPVPVTRLLTGSKVNLIHAFAPKCHPSGGLAR